MRTIFLPTGVGFVLSIPHWEYTRSKTTKTRKFFFFFWSSASTNLLLYVVSPGQVPTRALIYFFMYDGEVRTRGAPV